jgi:hypothetical protein
MAVGLLGRYDDLSIASRRLLFQIWPIFPVDRGSQEITAF